MQTPAKNLYQKYGDPERVVEFRIFSFNNCGAGCRNCFYKKTNNNYYDFSSVHSMAAALRDKEYTLETCYLLPTDVFENDFNFKVFEDPSFVEVVSLFNFVGLATTLRNGFKADFFDRVLGMNDGKLKIELHVNLREDLIHDETYLNKLKEDLIGIKSRYGESILVNLALNLGTPLTREEHHEIQRLVVDFSDDKILEMNFTFMFNPAIPRQDKIRFLINSYPSIQFFSDEYAKTEMRFNKRTLLRKPSLVFKDEEIYLTPIIPFDEYIFLDDDFCKLKNADWISFLETYLAIESRNEPILSDCHTCSNLQYCQGKAFFSLAQTLKLPCFKEGSDVSFV
jgi:hypothetical protein